MLWSLGFFTKLKPCEAIVYSKHDLDVNKDYGDDLNVTKVRIRKRLTKDGGSSRTRQRHIIRATDY